MADEVLKENDGDEEIVIIETPAEGAAADGEKLAAEGEARKPGIEDDDDADVEDDERLGANEADTDEGLTPTQIKRKHKREREKRARQAQETELADLRASRVALETRLAAIEGNALGLNQATLEARIQQARSTIATAEHVRQQAEAAGNVGDAVAAIGHRDAAYADLAKLEPALNDITRIRSQPAPQQQQPANTVSATLAAEWKAANPWYSDASQDANSVITRQISAELVQQGSSEGTRAHWQALSKKLSETLSAGTQQPKPNGQPQQRKQPPTGQRGEGSPVNGKPREVYLSAERIAAIKDAGKWDDPKERNRMVKLYMDYDRQHTAN